MIRVSRGITKQNISFFQIKHIALRLGFQIEAFTRMTPTSQPKQKICFLQLCWLSSFKTSAGIVRKQNWSSNRVCRHIEGFKSILIRLAFMFLCRGSPESSSIMNSVYCSSKRDLMAILEKLPPRSPDQRGIDH